MLIFNCSKKAAEFFTTSKKGTKSSPIEPTTYKTIAEEIGCPLNPTKQWNWIVHAIKINRKNVLIVMDYQTRYSITLTGLKKGDWIGFLNMFEHHLNVNVHEVLSLIPATVPLIDKSLSRYFRQHTTTHFYQRGDRSTQSHINDVAWHFEDSVYQSGYLFEEVELIGFDLSINHRLRKHKGAKDYFFPQHEFLKYWLAQYALLSQTQIERHFDDLNKKEGAEFRESINRFRAMQEPPSQDHEYDNDNVVSIDAFSKPRKL